MDFQAPLFFSMEFYFDIASLFGIYIAFGAAKESKSIELIVFEFDFKRTRTKLNLR
jgi:hypothetical protein